MQASRQVMMKPIKRILMLNHSLLNQRNHIPSNLPKDLGLILDTPLAPDQIPVSLLLQSQELSLDRRQGLPGSHASRSSKRQHEATYKLEMLEQEAARREMQRVLGTLEPAYRKPQNLLSMSLVIYSCVSLG